MALQDARPMTLVKDSTQARSRRSLKAHVTGNNRKHDTCAPVKDAALSSNSTYSICCGFLVQQAVHKFTTNRKGGV